MNEEHKENMEIIIMIFIYLALGVALTKWIIYTVLLNEKEIMEFIEFIKK
jgi:hypothetical protein